MEEKSKYTESMYKICQFFITWLNLCGNSTRVPEGMNKTEKTFSLKRLLNSEKNAL